MNKLKKSLLVAAVAALSSVAATGIFWPGTAFAQNEVPVCEGGGACESFFDTYINPFITLLTISIGIIAAISVVVAGIQYASAGDDPSKVSKARDRVLQTIIGLVAYIFLFAFLNYLIPGGLV